MLAARRRESALPCDAYTAAATDGERACVRLCAHAMAVNGDGVAYVELTDGDNIPALVTMVLTVAFVLFVDSHEVVLHDFNDSMGRELQATSTVSRVGVLLAVDTLHVYVCMPMCHVTKIRKPGLCVALARCCCSCSPPRSPASRAALPASCCSVHASHRPRELSCMCVDNFGEQVGVVALVVLDHSVRADRHPCIPGGACSTRRIGAGCSPCRRA